MCHSKLGDEKSRKPQFVRTGGQSSSSFGDFDQSKMINFVNINPIVTKNC
jgi:hypothetical protein